jgi:imidazoleglycerol-phosphate dehydratase
MRRATVGRRTKETSVEVTLNLDGEGKLHVSTGIAFLDHLISSLAKHGSFDLELRAEGDHEHHIVEDVAIAMGRAFSKALGDKLGIRRFGHALVPMDEVLVLVAVDLSGRSFCVNRVRFGDRRIEGMDSDLIHHFLNTFSSEFKINLHARLLEDGNEHHKAEALFKGLGIALREACSVVGEGVPSTKGVLE